MIYSSKYERDISLSIKNLDIGKLRSANILITGATGLIGSAIIDVLGYWNQFYQSEIHVYAAVRSIEYAQQRFKKWNDTEFLEFLVYEACAPVDFPVVPDYIIHLAGNAHPKVYGKEPVETIITNICGLNNLLKYAGNHSVKRVLYVSSSEVYGKKSNKESYRESDYGYVDLLNPRSCCPSSKRAAETLCAAYLKEYGVDSVIVRPGHIYGPTQTEQDSRASAQFLRAAAKGEDIVMKSDGLQLRSYCHCFDCATAILTVLLRGKSGEAYNISNPDSVVSIRDFAETCTAAAGRKICYENPSDAEKDSYNMMDNSTLDSSKLAELGWKGVWNLKTGVEESIQQLKVSARSEGGFFC